MKLLLSGAVSSLLLLGCGGSSNSTSTYETTAEILSVLESNEVPCSGYKESSEDEIEWGTEGALENGSCKVEGEDVDIIIWKDNGQRKNWEGLGKTLGCEMGRQFGVSEFDYLNGDTWTVSGTSKTLANQLAKVLGGNAVHITC
jgi:hypothetical protein